MLALRPAMPGKRFKPSGPNVPSAQRHTIKLEIRCAPELAASVRELCAARGVTLAQVLSAGLEALAAQSKTSSNPALSHGAWVTDGKRKGVIIRHEVFWLGGEVSPITNTLTLLSPEEADQALAEP